MKTAVYVHYDASGVVLYVGISSEPFKRQCGHAACSDWSDQIARIDFEWYQSRIEAVAAERKAIAALKPVHNVVWSNGQGPLAAYMQENGVRQVEMAEICETSQGTISRLCNGSNQPSPELAARIQTATDGFVRFYDWPAFSAFKPEAAA